MKNSYTIGEVSSLLGISAQTLRYYDKIGVVRPDSVNDTTGYRKYSYNQIHYIERVRYLQNFGLSLEEIKDALKSGSINGLTASLSKRKDSIDAEIAGLTSKKEDIQWYIDYYNHVKNHTFADVPFKTKEPVRYVLASPFYENEPLYGTAGYRLTQTKSNALFNNVSFLRQNGYILDFENLVKGKIVPTHYFVYLKEKPTFEHPFIKEIPAGAYFCVQSKILSEPFDKKFIQKYFASCEAPPIVLANEYEDNFENFLECMYEIQIKID